MTDLSTPPIDSSLFAVILAGGHGERFWPLSRKARPKHHLALFSELSLLESTLSRLEGLIPQERILVLTGVDQAEATKRLLPSLPPENLIVEPLRRDTAAAMALAAGVLARRDPQATAIVLPSDHHIPSIADFQRTLTKAVAVAQHSQNIVAIAIQPDWPCPGFGYLELGAAQHITSAVTPQLEAFPILRFREKPSAETAAEYLSRGNFRWNAGMFVWTVQAMQEALEKTAPALFDFYRELQQAEELDHFLAERFASVPKISFDFAVMEKLEGTLAIEAEFEWDDLGGWSAVGKYLTPDNHQNASNAPLQVADASGNIVYTTHANQHVALLGVKDLIVVNTGDALLVCPKDRGEELKQIVANLPGHLA